MTLKSISDSAALDIPENTDQVFQSENESLIRTLVQDGVVQPLVRRVGKVNDSHIHQILITDIRTRIVLGQAAAATVICDEQ